jgi:D-serine deaminase-like pyridoxal phosphate-dependent protein
LWNRTISPRTPDIDDTVEVTPFAGTRNREAVDGSELDLLEQPVADGFVALGTVDPLEFDGLGVAQAVPTAGVGGIDRTDAGNPKAVVRVADPAGGLSLAVGGRMWVRE